MVAINRLPTALPTVRLPDHLGSNAVTRDLFNFYFSRSHETRYLATYCDSVNSMARKPLD